MTKEFLLECERKLAKSYVCTALGRDDDSIAITKEIAKEIASALQELMNRFQFVKEEVKIDL